MSVDITVEDMGKLVHLLAIVAFASLQVISTDAGYYKDDDYYEYEDYYYYYDDDEPQCPNENEVYDPCFSPCLQKRCDYDPRLVRCAPPPKLGDPGCVAGCRCADGYVRNGELCVRQKECKKICRKPNEVYDVCPGTCPRRVCGFDDRLVLCKPQPKPGSPNCKRPACRCKDGYYRDNKGNCVVWKKCRTAGCGGDMNAAPGCGTNCGKKCSDLGKSDPGVCPLICRLNACDCKEGYYYDENTKKCVLPEKCSNSNPEPEPTTVCDDTNSKASLLRQGNYDFTGKLLYQIMKANPRSSVVASPFSILIPLGQLALCSKGETYSEIINKLNLKTKQELRCSFPSFLDEVQASEGTELSLGAKVYVKDGSRLSDSFQSDAKDVFRAEAECIDFSKPNQAADTINQWVSGATKGKIPQLVSADMFDPLTRLVLANAIYFKGTWKKEFNPEKTKKADFYVDSENTKKVDMMQQKEKMNYYTHTDIDAQTIQLPYKDGNITFVVILPNQKDGISDLVEKLQDGATLDRAVSTFTYETVNLLMPKMKIETTSNLKDVLSATGIKRIFSSKAQLDGMLVPNEPLYVSHAIQKATINVDETGSEAAAANAFVVARLTKAYTKPRKEITFRADHPYVYCIKVRKVVIFCGINYG